MSNSTERRSTKREADLASVFVDWPTEQQKTRAVADALGELVEVAICAIDRLDALGLASVCIPWLIAWRQRCEIF